jgi:hypothetical protein
VTIEPHRAALPARHPRADEPMTWPEFSDRVLRGNVVSVAAYGLIAVQLVWKAAVLRHFYFWQDDFTYFDRAVHTGLTWHYLMFVQAGHLDPGPFALSWVIARISEYNWTLVSAVLLAILLASCLALLKLLRALFGNRPAILIPLVIYLLCPLTIPDLVWWSNGIEGVTLALATFMSLDAHIRYLRTRRIRPMIAAAAWLLVGMLFSDKGLVLPFLLFGVTSAFFVDGSWLRAALRSGTQYWRAWAVYGGLLAAYGTVFAIQLTTPGAVPTNVGSPHGVGTFMTDLIKDSFVPGAFGGPWRWFGNGIDAFATPPAALWRLALLAAAAVVVATIWYRRYAWRAWAILALWLLVADIAPIIVGRTVLLDPALTVFLGLDTHYVADAVPVLAICLGMAVWPVVGRPDHRRIRQQQALPTQVAPMMTGFVLAAFALGSVYSVQTYVGATTSQPGRSFIATVRQALAATPRGTPVVDQLTPSGVMASLLLGAGGYEDQTIGSMALGRIRWIRQSDGVIANLKIFTPDGQLWPAAVVGVYSRLMPSSAGGCWPSRADTITVPLNSTATVTNGPWTLRMSYVASAAQDVSVYFGGRWAQIYLKSGENTACLPAEGTGASVIVLPQDPRALCVGNIAVGGLFQNKSDTPVPAVPAPG